AYTRYGWVHSSFILNKVFYDSLFANPGRTAVEAMYAAKSNYSYSRDLIYGQNFFGDPALRLYCDRPVRPQLTVTPDGPDLSIRAHDGSDPISDARLIISDSIGTKLADLITDSDGRAKLFGPIAANITISVVKTGCIMAQVNVSQSLITDLADEERLLPQSFALEQNYPNPFNPTTTINYSLDERAYVTLTIFNVLGRTVARLVDKEQAAGDYQIDWRAAESAEEAMASAVYFYRLQAGELSDVKKMTLVR
ncbi:MAG: T9SS type A sorting domain-containing protein, partial [candidate division Zixibacteria bacterium]